LQTTSVTWRGRLRLLRAALRRSGAAPGEQEALARMGLQAPGTLGERIQQRLLQTALRR
jgi:hypothetical protein